MGEPMEEKAVVVTSKDTNKRNKAKSRKGTARRATEWMLTNLRIPPLTKTHFQSHSQKVNSAFPCQADLNVSGDVRIDSGVAGFLLALRL